ncbi:L-aspartate oxidase [Nonomuraea typhae]|uniref:L-aspartate oxidase n=1 Tax=Nonomuraea typhae TaxID=2603600 RepID=A0ABW7YVP0_9ACTN
MSGPAIPLRLSAPEPGWTREADVVVVGSGVAGLTVALRHAELNPEAKVLVVTKDVLGAGSTRFAQGGIAAVLDPADTPEEHLNDTLIAGVGLCDAAAVRALVTEGPDAVRRLIERGAEFDRTDGGELQLGREGGHRRNRVVHAGGDATGAEVQRALVAALHERGIEVIEHALVLDLLKDAEGRAAGVTLHVMGEGARDGVGAVHAGAVVLATGGMGQIYQSTTNPLVSTGDGVALALRAGAVVRDLEFVQFHPTVLRVGEDAAGQQPLITEAVRGEGALLVDEHGKRFMDEVHELAELAPRDVVAKAIMRQPGQVYLDGRHFGEEKWRTRFPTVRALCLEHGLDPAGDLIPVVPAAHYASGGVRTDLHGRTSIPGLYACGEVACTGVHGANRLASNSLLEGLVFAERIAQDIEPSVRRAVEGTAPEGLCDPRIRPRIQAHMSRGAGVLRSRESLALTAKALRDARWTPVKVDPRTEAWEATNLLTVATVLTAVALAREETRGSHWREDHGERDDERWLGHLDVRLTEEGLHMTYTPHGLTLDAGAPEIQAVIDRALAEDLQEAGDVTSLATIPEGHRSAGDVVARQAGIVAGLGVAEAVFARLGAGRTTRLADDGQRVKAGEVLMTVEGDTRALLTAERTALNLLTHLSGIATLTGAWVAALEGTGARVRDSRKTLPGLRALEKYAVRAGGGVNHRMSLSDAALIKDNHVVAAGGVAAAFEAVRERFPGVPVEVEVDTLEQLEEALSAGAEVILLDNFTVEQMAHAVQITKDRAKLEASGGLTLEKARDVAETGVDYLAVGSLTHSAPALDIALDLRG